MPETAYDISSLKRKTTGKQVPERLPYDLSGFKRKPVVQGPPLAAGYQPPEQPDDSMLGSAKRMLGGFVQAGANVPHAVETANRLQNRLQRSWLEAIGAPQELTQANVPHEQEQLKYAQEVSKAGKKFSEEQIGAKPGSPITFKSFAQSPLRSGARLAIETLPMTASLAAITAANPPLGVALMTSIETGGVQEAFDDLEQKGLKVDPAYRDYAAAGVGALNAALEKFGIDKILARANPAIRGRLFNLLSSGALNAVPAPVRKIGAAAGTEAATETLQELNGILAEAGVKIDAAQAKNLQESFDIAWKHTAENLPRLQQSALGGAVGGAGTAGIVEGLRSIGKKPEEPSLPPATPIDPETERAKLRERLEEEKAFAEKQRSLEAKQQEATRQKEAAAAEAKERKAKVYSTIENDLAQLRFKKNTSELTKEQAAKVKNQAGAEYVKRVKNEAGRIALEETSKPINKLKKEQQDEVYARAKKNVEDELVARVPVKAEASPVNTQSTAYPISEATPLEKPSALTGLNTPDDVIKAQQKRIDELEAKGATEDDIANDAVLQALEKRNREIHDENAKAFAEFKATGETDLKVEEAKPVDEPAKAEAKLAEPTAQQWQDTAKEQGYTVLGKDDLVARGIKTDADLAKWVKTNLGNGAKTVVDTPRGWSITDWQQVTPDVFDKKKEILTYRPEEKFASSEAKSAEPQTRQEAIVAKAKEAFPNNAARQADYEARAGAADEAGLNALEAELAGVSEKPVKLTGKNGKIITEARTVEKLDRDTFNKSASEGKIAPFTGHEGKQLDAVAEGKKPLMSTDNRPASKVPGTSISLSEYAKGRGLIEGTITKGGRIETVFFKPENRWYFDEFKRVLEDTNIDGRDLDVVYGRFLGYSYDDINAYFKNLEKQSESLKPEYKIDAFSEAKKAYNNPLVQHYLRLADELLHPKKVKPKEYPDTIDIRKGIPEGHIHFRPEEYKDISLEGLKFKKALTGFKLKPGEFGISRQGARFFKPQSYEPQFEGVLLEPSEAAVLRKRIEESKAKADKFATEHPFYVPETRGDPGSPDWQLAVEDLAKERGVGFDEANKKALASRQAFKFDQAKIVDKGGGLYMGEYRGSLFDFVVNDKDKEVYIANIVVPKELRGKGLGTSIVRDFINYVKRQHPGYKVTAEAMNPAAARMNEKAGMRKVSGSNVEYTTERPIRQYERAEAQLKDLITDYKAQGIKPEEWQVRAEVELKKQGYSDNIIKKLVDPYRARRPDEPFGLHTATTRAGRQERAVEPPPELKRGVDEIAEGSRLKQVTSAYYEQARQEIISDIEKAGGTVVYDDTNQVYRITVMPSKASAADQMAARTFEQTQKPYTLEDVGKGFEIAGTPSESVGSIPKLEGTLADKVAQLIYRKQLADKAKSAYDRTKARHKDDLVDRFLTEEKPVALIGRTKDGLPVEVMARQARSKGTPTGEPRKVSDKPSLRIAQAKGEIDRSGKLYTFIEKGLTETEKAQWKANVERSAKSYGGLRSNSPFDVKAGLEAYADLAEIGYLTFKSLSRQAGKAIDRAVWEFRMLEDAIQKGYDNILRPYLGDMWNAFQKGWKPGNPIDPPTSFNSKDFVPPKSVAKKPKVAAPPAKLPEGYDQLITGEQKGTISRRRPVKYYMQPIVDKVGEVHSKVANDLRQATDYWSLREAQLDEMGRPIKIRIKRDPKALSRLNRFSREDGKSAWTDMHDVLTGEKAPDADLKPIEKDFLSTYKGMISRGQDMLVQAGLEIKNRIDFKRVPSIDLIGSIRSESGIVYDTLVKELNRLNPEMSVEAIKTLLKNYRLESFKKFPTHIDIGNKSWIPVLAADGASALDALARDYSRRAGIISKFGSQYSKTLKEIRKQIPASHQADYDTMVEAYFGRRQAESTHNMGARVAKGLVSPIVSTAMLAKAGVVQLGQLAAAPRLTGGKALLKGLYNFVIHPLRTRAELEAVGAYSRAIFDPSLTKGREIESVGRIASHLLGQASLTRPLVQKSDLAAGAAMKAFADAIKERGGKLSTSEKAALKSLDFTDAEIELINKNGFEGYPDSDVLYSGVIRRGKSGITQTGKKGIELSKFQLSPLMQELMKFEGFNIGQGQALSQAVDRVRFAKGTGERAIGLKQLALLVGGSAAAAEMNYFLKSIINGYDPDRGEPEEGKFDWRRFWEDVVESGFAGPWRSISMAFQNDSLPITPLSVLEDFRDMVSGKGRYLDKEGYERAFEFVDRFSTRPVTQWFGDTGRAIGVAAGLADPGNPTLKTALRNYWQWRKDEGTFEESGRAGYDEMQRAMKDLMKVMKEVPVALDKDGKPNPKISEETRTKITQALAHALKIKVIDLSMKGTRNARQEASNRVKLAIQARRTILGYLDEDGQIVIKGKAYTPEQITKGVRDEKFYDALVMYDSLLDSLADSL